MLDGSVTELSRAAQRGLLLKSFLDADKEAGDPELRRKYLDKLRCVIKMQIEMSVQFGADFMSPLLASYGLSCIEEELAKIDAAPTN